MPELDEKRVREIVKEEIGSSKIPERLSNIEHKVDNLKIEINLKFENVNLKIDSLKEQMKDDKKMVVGFFVLVLIAVIGAALAK